MRTVLVIGIGAGDPQHLTLQAVAAIRRTDVFFVTEQTKAGRDLAAAREDMIEEHAGDHAHRTVELLDPPRDRTDPDYEKAVDAWRLARADLWGRTIAEDLKDGETGAFLVWGDPALYDSTIWVLEQVLAAGTVSFDYEVIPGISSVSALAARHRIPLNRVGEPVVISTGRRVVEGRHDGAPDVVVMLDAQHAFTHAADDIDVYWGAYLGTPDELLISGPVREVEAEIQRVRAEARERIGWVMDAYLLRRAVHRIEVTVAERRVTEDPSDEHDGGTPDICVAHHRG